MLFFYVQKMPQASWKEGVREGFFKFRKCPKPRGRGVCARDVAIDLMTAPKLSKNVSKMSQISW